MTVLPTPNIPRHQALYLGSTPPAGLQILARPNRVLPPAAADGPGLPSDKINPNSGIYDENGRLPQIPGPGSTILAYV